MDGVTISDVFDNGGVGTCVWETNGNNYFMVCHNFIHIVTHLGTCKLGPAIAGK